MKTYYSCEFVQSPFGYLYHHLKDPTTTQCGKVVDNDWHPGGPGIPSTRIEVFCKKCMGGRPFIIVAGGIVQ